MDDTLGGSYIECAGCCAKFLLRCCAIATSDRLTKASDRGLERGANRLIALLCLGVGLDALDLRLDVGHEKTSRNVESVILRRMHPVDALLQRREGYQPHSAGHKPRLLSLAPGSALVW